MRCVVQRVAHASVTVNEQKIAAIGAGYLVLVGVEDGDGENDMIYCADKIAGLRIFEDENGKMNLSIEDVRRRYSPQIASRLEGEYRVLPFFGDDIRLLKKQKI